MVEHLFFNHLLKPVRAVMGLDIDECAWNLILQGSSEGSRYMELNPTRLV